MPEKPLWRPLAASLGSHLPLTAITLGMSRLPMWKRTRFVLCSPQWTWQRNELWMIICAPQMSLYLLDPPLLPERTQ